MEDQGEEIRSEPPIDIEDDDGESGESEYGSDVEPYVEQLTDGSILEPIPPSQPEPEPVEDTVPTPASNEAVVGSDDDVGQCSDAGSAGHVVESKGAGKSHGTSNGSLVENMPASHATGDAEAEECSYDNFTPEDKKLPYIPPETEEDRALKLLMEEEMQEMKYFELHERIANTQKILADLRAAQNAQTLAWYENVTSFLGCLSMFEQYASLSSVSLCQTSSLKKTTFNRHFVRPSFHASHLPGLPAASLCRRRLTRKARSWFVTVSHLVWTPWTLCRPILMR